MREWLALLGRNPLPHWILLLLNKCLKVLKSHHRLLVLLLGNAQEKPLETNKPDSTYQLAEVLFMNAWGHDPKADVNDLITRALEAAIAYDERIELLKHSGLVSIKDQGRKKDGVTTDMVTPSEPTKAKLIPKGKARPFAINQALS